MQSDRSRKLGKFVCTYQFRAKVKTVFVVVGFFVIHANLDLFGLHVIELILIRFSQTCICTVIISGRFFNGFSVPILSTI